MAPELEELAEFVGLNERVRAEFLDDPFVKNYYEYESGQAKPIIKGRLKSALSFWRDTIKAPASVLAVIESGFTLDFIVKPPKMHFKNNRSAYDNCTFVNLAVKDLLDLNLIVEVKDRPHVVSPLSVATNGNKKRLILDLSILNEYIIHEKIKLEDQNDFYELAKFCKYVACYDIKSCYHQIDMNEEFVTYLGFEWFHNGAKRYFIFLVVPFGLSSAPRICKKLFRPLVKRWRLLGIVNILYYDDGIIGGFNYKTTLKSSNIVFNDLLKCHILPNAEKSCWKPVKILDWLGYTWNFNDNIVKVTERREEMFLYRLNCLKATLPIVTPRAVALVVGSLISMFLVFGEKALMFCRFMQNIINFRSWEELGWDSSVNINHIDFGSAVKEEIQFLELNFVKLNSRSFQPRVRPHKVLFGDAGEHGAGGLLFDGVEQLQFRITLPHHIQGYIFNSFIF
jgi:hypothetical protein